MLSIAKQSVAYKRLWLLCIIALLAPGCSYYQTTDELAEAESEADLTPNPRILYLDVRSDGTTCQLIEAYVVDEAYSPAAVPKVLGRYGVQVVSDNNEVIYDRFTWTEPINGTLSLPFYDDTAFIELIRRTDDEKTVICRFGRDVLPL